MQEAPGKTRSLLSVYEELAEYSKAARQGAESGDADSVKLIGYLEGMMDVAFYPVEATVYSTAEEQDVDDAGNLRTTPAGYAWQVVAVEGVHRHLKCWATGAQVSKSIEELTTLFALVPASLPDIYRADVRLSPAQLDDKYGEGPNLAHPFFTCRQWRQHVVQNRTISGYWVWLSQQLHGIVSVEAA